MPSSQSFSSATDLYFELIKATYYTCSRATKFISQVLILSLSTQIQHIDLKCFELSMCFSHGITVLKSDDLAWLYTLWLSISFTYLGYVDLHFVCLSNFLLWPFNYFSFLCWNCHSLHYSWLWIMCRGIANSPSLLFLFSFICMDAYCMHLLMDETFN